MVEFGVVFNQFMCDRIDEIGRSILIESKEYNQLNANCIKLFNVIYNQLPSSTKELLHDYEITTSLLQGLAEFLMYEQGLKDGYCLNNIISDTKPSE